MWQDSGRFFARPAPGGDDVPAPGGKNRCRRLVMLEELPGIKTVPVLFDEKSNAENDSSICRIRVGAISEKDFTKGVD